MASMLLWAFRTEYPYSSQKFLGYSHGLNLLSSLRFSAFYLQLSLSVDCLMMEELTSTPKRNK